MNVLSLFDGMSCGQIALERSGIKVDNYFASEIDKYAIQVTQKNYPNTIQIGDVTKVFAKDLPKIKLLIGGSPCQGFSFAGKQLNFDDPRSKLFFEYVRLLKECKPEYFLLENVKMKKEYQNIISKELGVEPILINSALVSAQSRKRLYWTNIPNIVQPADKRIYLDDIISISTQLEHRLMVKEPNRYLPEIVDSKYVDPYNQKNIYNKSITVRTNYSTGNLWVNEDGWRRLTVLECERLQTVPENYTEGVSNAQRYKMLGNGWTVDVISHIFNHIPN